MNIDHLLEDADFRHWLSCSGFNVSRIRENNTDNQIKNLWISFYYDYEKA